MQPPSLDTLADLAKQVNSQPVPEPSAANKHGLRLPPERDCITQPNQQLVLPDSAAGGGSGADGAAAR